MCRWIAYRGETTAFEHYVTEPEHSLVTQSIRALESTAGTNGDGFGLGWYGDHPEPGLYRETRPAWSDENLRYLCRHLHSHLFFAHVRAATGTAVTRQNCHPFACGRWLFMHNGFVGSWNRLRRKVEALIPDALYPSRLGTTDSEAVFSRHRRRGHRSGPDRRDAQGDACALRARQRGRLARASALHVGIIKRSRSLRVSLRRKRSRQLALLPRRRRSGHRRLGAVRQGAGLDRGAAGSRARCARVATGRDRSAVCCGASGF
ncbi:class II glutamine amidotransferase [Bradyrhizobium sp. USDA 4353]